MKLKLMYGLCLLGEKNFGLLLTRVPKLSRKSLIFLLLLIFVVSNYALDRMFKKI